MPDRSTRDSEELKRRLIKALKEKGLSPSEAEELVDRMWPVLDAIRDAIRDAGAV